MDWALGVHYSTCHHGLVAMVQNCDAGLHNGRELGNKKHDTHISILNDNFMIWERNGKLETYISLMSCLCV